MTSPWLKLALDAVGNSAPEIGAPCAESVFSAETLSEGEHSSPFGTKNTNGTPPGVSGTRWDAADIEERTALVAEVGEVPDVYAASFARLMQEIPAGVPVPRWQQFVNDAGLFLDLWGKQAAALAWTPDDLFGMDPAAPLARYDRLGLLWLLQGRAVRLIDANSATIAGGLVYRRTAQCST